MKKGFTLVELMVVVAIIALLTGIIMTNLTSSRVKARDAKRISDVGQIQLALTLFYDRCHQYPSIVNGGVDITSPSCTINNTTITPGTFISTIPTDPSNKPYDYAIIVSGTPATNSDFMLHTKLESQNVTVQKDSYPNASFNQVPNGWKQSAGVTGVTNWSSQYCYDPAAASGANGYLDYCLGSK